MTSGDYRTLLPGLIDSGGGRLSIALDKLLDILSDRATILASEISRPGLDPIKTELLRGRREECLLLLSVLKDRVPRPIEPLGFADLNLQSAPKRS